MHTNENHKEVAQQQRPSTGGILPLELRHHCHPSAVRFLATPACAGPVYPGRGGFLLPLQSGTSC